MKVHDLKILPEYYDAVRNGTKRFELRRDDRGFQVRDVLCLWKTIKDGTGRPQVTGEVIWTEITYILRGTPQYGLGEGYAILSLGECIEGYEETDQCSQ